MIQIYTDGALAYDSRLDRYDLATLKVTTGLNIGGTAEILMQEGHPAYNNFVDQRTIVTIYRDGALRFRGRALYHLNDYHQQQTIICEGELCLFRDSISRPYLYQASPRSILVTLVNAHNEQVEEFKRFKVGEVTVTDPNDYTWMESESAQTTLDTINKLVSQCGGYLVFTDDEDGSRVINWYAELDHKSEQVIEFGENLLDFSKTTGESTGSLATGLVPYGAKDEVTGKPITIESVNDGKDYIINEEARKVCGTIMTTVTFDDITLPENLLKKAQIYLREHSNYITSLELTAVDLSYLDKDLDSFAVGDYIRVVSAPHGINEDFQLSQLTEDLLNPANSRITLGKRIQSLTGASVSGDSQGLNELNSMKSDYNKTLQEIQNEVVRSVAGAVEKMDTELARFASGLEHEVAERRKAIIHANPEGAEVGTTYVGGADGPIRLTGSKIEFGVSNPGGAEIIFGDINTKSITSNASFDFVNNHGIRAYNTGEGTRPDYILRVDSTNKCIVGNDYCNLYLRGKDNVYLHKTGATVTSDRRHKNSIEELPEAYIHMLDKLTPVRFRYNGKGDRYHLGFIAQDVDAALADVGLTREEFAGFVDVVGDGSELGLVYDEFIALLLQKNRQLEARLEALEKIVKMEE